MGIAEIVLVIFLFLIGGFFAYYYISSMNDLKEKDLLIANLEDSNKDLESGINVLQSERDAVKSLLSESSENTESNLRNPTFEELMVFIKLDDTNKLIYSDSFDCTGFAIELFKRARANGLRCGLAEIEYVDNVTGHILNIFQTSDKGLVFVDSSGDVNGTGQDRIGYLEVGESYGAISLSGISSKLPKCDIVCSQMKQGLDYVEYDDVFDYDYFDAFKECTILYENCTMEYNLAVTRYNSGIREYTHSEIQNWFDNLHVLEDYVVGNKFYFLTESYVVKNVEIYW